MADRSVLITGGTGGLGGAVTAAFVADGWRVVLPARRAPAEVDGAEVVPTVDLTDPAAVARAVAVAAGDAGRAAAGRGEPRRRVRRRREGARDCRWPTSSSSSPLNLRPTFLVTQAALPHLVAAGGGSVVCVSSRAAVRAVRRCGRLHRVEGRGDRVRAGRRGGVPRRRGALQRRAAERDRHPGQPGGAAGRRPQPLGRAGRDRQRDPSSSPAPGRRRSAARPFLSMGGPDGLPGRTTRGRGRRAARPHAWPTRTAGWRTSTTRGPSSGRRRRTTCSPATRRRSTGRASDAGSPS